MFLFPNGKQYIVNYLNSTFSANLSPDELDFGTPRSLDENELALYPTKTDALNIKALNTAKVYGQMDVFYNRLSLDKLFGLETSNPVVVPVALQFVNTVHDCLSAIQLFLGVEFTPDDIEDLVVDKDRKTMSLVAKPNSLLWVGETTVAIKQGDAVLGDIVNPNKVDVYPYPYFNTNNGQGPIYGYATDYTDAMRPYKDRGIALTDRELLTVLSSTGNPWTIYRSPSNWNLFESKVIYNGKNTDAYPTDPYYERVCVVELALYCTNLAGYLYLHYNTTIEV